MSTPLTKAAPTEPSGETVNEELYSRQLYVLGAAAQRRLQQAKILVSGELSGLAAELCKNIVLAGVNSVCLHDDSACQFSDLASAGFAVCEMNVTDGVSRSAALINELRDLNPNVSVTRTIGMPDYRAFDVVVLVNCARDHIEAVCSLLRKSTPEATATTRTRFIVTGMYGLFAYTFSDFGDSWEVLDTDGEIAKSGLIIRAQLVSNAEEVEITTEVPHRLSEGDRIKFNFGQQHSAIVEEAFAQTCDVRLVCAQSSTKVEECRFRIKLSSPLRPSPQQTPITALEGAYFEQVKQPVTITTHVPFSKSLDDPRIVNNSFDDETRPSRLLALLTGIWAFQESHNRAVPAAGQANEAQFVASFAERRLPSMTKPQREELLLLASSASGKLSAVASFMGGVAGQEVLKACTGKFMPLDQWLLFSAPECLYAAARPSLPVVLPGKPQISRYEGVLSVFGADAQKKLGALKVLVVGAGALGCELLKILALSGISTRAGGGVTFITDPDSIEMSNLSRQFLFRAQSVGKNKAQVAAETCRRMNPDFNVEAFQERVCAETATTVFNDTFWDSLDLVINALDNVPSRLYVDSQCVYYSKPLLESGTLGTKANTLPIIPLLTESYGSDPVKDFDSTPEIPACTLHAYPTLFEHTLQWARDAVFERDFVMEPSEAKEFLDSYRATGSSEAYLSSLLRQPNSICQRVRAARGVICGISPSDHGEGLFPYHLPTHLAATSGGGAVSRPFTFADCVHLARLRFEELFKNKVELLLFQHPPGSKDGDVPFWSGKRRQPFAAKFDESDPVHILFIQSTARLLAQVHQVPKPSETNLDVIKLLRQVCPVLPNVYKPAPVALPNTSGASATPSANDGTMWKADVDLMECALKNPSENSLMIEPVRFDKDNDLHIDLVWSTALIRAKNYNIPVMDKMEAKRVVGRIIPAIATTTAAACGLVALELFKYVLSTPFSRKVEYFRASNMNLAVNSFASFEPRPCVSDRKFGRMDCNLWSVITLKGNLTVDDLICTFEREFGGFHVTSISTVGDITLYNDLFSMDENDRLMPVADLYRKVVGKEPPQVFIPLTVDGDFEDDDDSDEPPLIPPVRLRWKDTGHEDGFEDHV